MEARLRTRFGPSGLILDGGEELDLFAGEIHYWRLPRTAWRDVLRGAAELGLGVVSTYVPWGVHEPRRGQLSFAGDLDLGAFLDEAAALGLRAIVRPGPHINAELTGFGYPRWLLEDPSVQAVSARGTPVWMPAPPHMFPVPSYASAAFREATGGWLRAVAEVVAPRLHPDGPVVALQVDNEMQHFFRVGAYDHGYHPDALAWWHEEHDDEPPRSWDPSRRELCLRWVAFQERSTERALGWLGDALDAAGLAGVARFHNAPPSDPRLTCVPAMERAVGAAGMDFYHPRGAYDLVRERALYLAGSTALPFAPELGVGGPPWLPPMGEAEQRDVTLGVLAGGVRAFNLYMLADRERWYGAALDAAGRAQGPARFLRDLLATLREVAWTRLRRDAVVAVLTTRAESRAAVASSLVDPLTPVIAELAHVGPAGHCELAAEPGPRRQRLAERAVLAALDLAEVPYIIVDEACLDRLPAAARAVIVPTDERVDGATWAALHLLAEGGLPVVLGPARPTRDELDRPLGDDAALPRGAGLIRGASLEDVGGLAEDLLALAGDLSDDWIAPEEPDAHVSAFRDPDGAVRALAVGNRSGYAVTARVTLGAGARLHDPLGGAPIRAGRDVADVPLAPHQVRLFPVS